MRYVINAKFNLINPKLCKDEKSDSFSTKVSVKVEVLFGG
jgi:hypothetical protein